MAIGYRPLAYGWRSRLAMVASAALCVAGCGRAAIQFSGPTMGTRYNITCLAEAGADDAEALQQKVDARLAEINRRMSTYDPESELSQFNLHTGDDWFEVSLETARVVAYALEVAKDSGGAFDPTVGPVVNLWGFGPGGRKNKTPTEAEIEAARALVGYQSIEARLAPPALRKTKSGVYLDLSAVAKGYASDAIAELLTDEGVAGCMVEIGGEVATRGTKPGGAAWRIGVEKPDETGRSIQLVVELSGDGLATSGDYRNYFESDGVRYSHTIDPTTGSPVTHDLATVTVRAASCMEADALATALLVMGRERGYDWASQRGIAALMIQRTQRGPVEKSTPNW